MRLHLRGNLPHGPAMTAQILEKHLVYDRWYRFYRLSMQMPTGAIVERHLEDHGSATAVLPYDTERRTALLVSMPRAPVIEAGGPPLLEAIAGNLSGYSPEDAARKEAMEEAGVALGGLTLVSQIWSLPAFSTERVHLFLARYTHADLVAPGGGLEEEHEGITVHEIALAELGRLVHAGMITDAKTLILSQSLMIARPDLFLQSPQNAQG